MQMVVEKECFLHTRFLNSSDNFKASGILDFFQDMAGLHADALNIGFNFMKDKNLAWVILGASYHIVSNDFKILTDLKVKTWPKTPKKIEFEREFEIRSNEGKLLCYGDTLWCLIDYTKRTIARSNVVSFSGEYYDFTRFSDGIKRKLNLEINEVINEYNYTVESSDVDHNGHLNNARYLELVENMLGMNKCISDLEVCFIHEVMYKETLTIKQGIVGDYNYFIGYVNNSIAFEAKVIVKE